MTLSEAIEEEKNGKILDTLKKNGQSLDTVGSHEKNPSLDTKGTYKKKSKF